MLLSRLFIALLLSLTLAQAHAELTVPFAGHDWVVRAGTGGPGPNHFDARNVRLDAEGRLHLRIVYRAGRWTTAEVFLREALGFGTYEFVLEGRPDLFDPNVVLGLFHYTLPGIGPDGTNEIDLEFSRWGDPLNPAGNWTVYPAVTGPAPRTQPYALALAGSTSTHRYVWRPCQVRFRALQGAPGQAGFTEIAQWSFAPARHARRIPQQPLPVHMNFWLFRGQPPADGQNAEIVISGFRYTPLPANDAVCG